MSLVDKKKDLLYEFGNYRLYPVNKLFLRENDVIPLSPKPFETLSYLVENSGRTVLKEELLENVWAGSFVEESNLTQTIFHLRKILKSETDKEKYIETIPKRGYRFVAPVKVGSGDLSEANRNTFNRYEANNNGIKDSAVKHRKIDSYQKPQRGKQVFFLLTGIFIICGFIYLFWLRKPPSNITSSSLPYRSIAVLPFKQIDAQNNSRIEEGMADALITKLSNLQQIRVRPTNSIIQAKQIELIQIGQELEVETILTGTIQEADEQIRVTVQLIKVSDGTTIWGEKFDTSAKKIFEVQDDISEKVSLALVNQLNEKENRLINKRYTNSVKAYQAYSKGRFLWNKRSKVDLLKAVEYFQQAIQEDSQYALAYSGLADCYIILVSKYVDTPRGQEYQKLAKDAALKALELDNTLTEPHTTLAGLTFMETGDWQATEKQFLKSIELNPNYSTARHWYSLHLFIVGQPEKAEVEMKKALELDPVSFNINNALGQIYYFSRRYELAAEQFQKTLELAPDFATPNIFLSLTLLELGQKDKAISSLENFLKNHPQDTSVQFALSHLLGAPDKANEAAKFLKLSDKSALFQYGIAIREAHLGNKEKALKILESISNSRNLNLILLFKYDPRLDILRNEPKFEEIFAKRL